MTDTDRDIADVVAVFAGVDADVIDIAVPWLVLTSGLDVGAAPIAVQASMLRFAERAGLTAGMSPATVSSTIAAFFAAHPLPAAVQQALAAVGRALVSDDTGSAAQRDAAAKMLGAVAAKLPVGAQPTPAGAMRNSPLARFTMTVPSKP